MTPAGLCSPGSSASALLILKHMAECAAPDRGTGLIEELQTMTLTVPEDVARLKAEHRSRNQIVEQLAICLPAVSTLHSISLTWEAPTKNRHAQPVMQLH